MSNYESWYTGQTYPAWDIPLTIGMGSTDADAVPEDLTGVDVTKFTMILHNTAVNPAVDTVGTGTFSIKRYYPAELFYKPSPADVALAFSGTLIVKALFPPSGTTADEMVYDPIPFTITAIPTTFVPPVPSAYVNVMQYGAMGNGTSDDTSAITLANNAVNAAGGGVVFFPPGTFLSGNQTIYPKVSYRGSGKEATIIKLKNGSNTDLFSAQTGSINLNGASSGRAQGTLYNFGFYDLTLDGNRTNQSSGPSYPLRFYGYSYILQNMVARNGYSGNILSDWGGGNNFATDSMESQWANIKTYGSGGIGVEYNGPHDSQFVNCVFFEEDSHCLHMCPAGAGAMFKNLHAWYPGATYQNAHRPITTYSTDSFSRANQSGLGTASDSETYTVTQITSTQTAQIASNQGKFSTVSEASYILGSQTITDGQYYIESALGGQNTNEIYLMFRYQNANNYYLVGPYGGTVYVQKVVAGVKSTITSLGGFTVGTSSLYSLRVQMVGNAIKVRWWITGQIEPAAWNISTTDSSLSSAGKYGFGAYIEVSGTPVVQNYYVQSVYTQSGKVGLLMEANGCQFDGCSVESSDTVQVVWLSSNSIWEGGAVYDFLPSPSSGFQIGQQASETAYAGQVLATSGLTNGMAPIGNRLSTYIVDCQGGKGSLWLDNDGGHNVFDLSINQDLTGVDIVGSLHLHSILREMYDDGTHASFGQLQLESGVMLNKSSTIYSGSGTPASTIGANGDFYFRTDTPGTANQRLYVKSSGSWTGIL